MAEFRVNTSGLDAAAGSYEKLAPLLEQAGSEVSSIKRSLSFQIRQRQRIETRLTRAAQKLDQEGRALRRVASVGKEAARLYQANEDKLLGMPERKTEEGASSQSYLDYLFTTKNLWTLVSKAGLLGQAVSIGGSLATSEWSASTAISTAKGVTSLVGEVAKTVSKGSSANWVEALFGTSKKATTGFWESVKDQVSSLNPNRVDAEGNPLKLGEKIGTYTKWAGYALTFASRGVKNYDAYGGVNAEMVAKTVVEGSVDIGLGIAATAGVTALLTVAGVASAPALVIAAGSAVVVMAGNALCKWATSQLLGEEKDIAQLASDVVWKVGGAIKSAGSSVVKWAGDALDSAGERIGDAAQKVKAGWSALTKWGQSPAYAGGGGW